MINFGVHSLLWAERFDIEPEPLVNKAKEIGFDALEIYVSPQQFESFDRIRVKKALESAEMKCIESTSLTLETDFTSSDEATRRRGINYLKEPPNSSLNWEPSFLLDLRTARGERLLVEVARKRNGTIRWKASRRLAASLGTTT
jgi:sugar phosphate isomerase/epimerase